MFSMNKTWFLILIFVATSIASDGSKPIPKSKTLSKITSEKKDMKRDKIFDSGRGGSANANREISKSGIGCQFGGERYFEGQYMPGVGGPCQACYCLRGQQQCTELRCKPPVKGCTPIFEDGACCPVRYECESPDIQSHRSQIDRKLPRKDLLSDLDFDYNFDYDLSSDIDKKVMKNHIRIVRESQVEHIREEAETVATTDLGIPDESSTVPTTSTTVLKVANNTPDAVEIEKTKATDFESTKMVTNTSIDKFENNEKESDLPVDNSNKEVEDIPLVEEAVTDNIGETVDKTLTKVLVKEDYADPTAEDENNITGTTEPPPEFYDDYYYDYEEDTTSIPKLSITEILTKLRNKNEGAIGSLVDILPDPITGENAEGEGPEAPVNEKEENKHKVHDFVSYDVDVGASIIAGPDESDDVIGVGQVIPIDLHTEEELHEVPSSQPPLTSSSTSGASSTSVPVTSTTTTSTSETTMRTTEITSTSAKPKPQSSFLDTFLNLFRGSDSSKKETKEPSPKLPPLPPPPPFLEKPPPPFLQDPNIGDEIPPSDAFEALPPSFFRPPPPPPPSDGTSSGIIKNEFDTETKANELDSELDFEAKPTIENEVRARPKPLGSVTRNQLPPLRRRPGTAAHSEGSKPFYPGLFGPRPKLPLSKFTEESEKEIIAEELPSDPVIEGGFSAIKQANDSTTTSTTTTMPEIPELADDKPTLPPSLPNLHIIPFEAADALVNQGSPPIEGNGFSPTNSFGISSAQDCREGGKVWKNGETVARGDNDPCVLCRCLSGKVICQRYECAKVPEGCTAEETPPEGECCPKITCDKSANVSIVDTLPSFRPIEEEEKEDSLSQPIRPSPFSHQNRRPPFISGLRRPLPSNPLSSFTKPQLQSAFRTTEEPPVETTEAKDVSKPSPVRPVRPFSRHPLKPLKPTTTSQPSAGRPRPFSFRNRTGTRPPFVPPRRRTSPVGLSKYMTSAKSSPEETKTTSVIFTTTLPSTTSRIPAFIMKSSTTVPHKPEEKVEEPSVLHHPVDDSFDHIFADLLPKDEDSLPQPIHSDTFEEVPPSDTFERVPPSSTFERVPPSDTFERVPPSSTFERVPPSDTFERVPPSNTFERVPPSSTFERVPPSDTFERVPPSSTFERVPPSSTFERVPPSDTFKRVPSSDTFEGVPPSDTFDGIPYSDALDEVPLSGVVEEIPPSDTIDEEVQPDRPPIVPPEILLSKPLPPPPNKITLDDGDIINFVQQDKFRFTTNARRPEVKFDRQPPISPIRIQKPTKRLPEIPEVVKAQLPLGNDPILVSGLLELAGCNVYGRMFEVGEDIQEISGQCKACQCTKVGVQCLPIC